MNELAKEMLDTANLMNKALVKINSDPEFYFDAEYCGDRISLEYKTTREVEAFLDNMFAEKCEDDGIEHLEEREDDADILKIDGDTGEVVERIKYELYYEGYHGDHAEHFNQSDFV